MLGLSASTHHRIFGAQTVSGMQSELSGPKNFRTTPDQAPVAVQSALPPAHNKTPQPDGNKQDTSLNPENTKPTDPSSPSKNSPKASQSDAAYTLDLSQAERQVLQELKSREREVKAHEQAHIAAGGQYVQGGANYSYRIGPDGKMYAVGGEVSIDVSPVPGDPQATIEKAEAIQRAAKAPAQPSAQDASVAAQAASMEMQAQMEVQREKREADKSQGPGSDVPAGTSIRSADNDSSEDGSPQVHPGQAGMSGRDGLAPASQYSGFPDRMPAFQGLYEYARMAARSSSPTAGLHIQA
ncbi:MAG: putative metalloprotease CJM1_0395 family protein [Desulfovermiculus sp.]